MSKESIGRVLAEYRRASRYTVSQVGSLVGKSGKTVSGWERGVGQPDADTLIALCRLYGIPDFNVLSGARSSCKPISEAAKQVAYAYDAAPAPIQDAAYRVLSPFFTQVDDCEAIEKGRPSDDLSSISGDAIADSLETENALIRRLRAENGQRATLALDTRARDE